MAVCTETYLPWQSCEISAWLAAKNDCIIFNKGFSPILKIYEGIDVGVGNSAAIFAITRDRVRISAAERRSTDLAKKQKSEHQKDKSQAVLEYEQVEGLLYGPRIADDW